LRRAGDLYLDTPGQVVDGLLISGCVIVAAPDVVIRNSRIRCVSTPTDRAVSPARGEETSGLLIEDTELDGGGHVEIGIDVSDAIIRRTDIHHFTDGIRLGVGVTVEDSWIHNMTRTGEHHPDAIQGISAQDVIIRGNRLDPVNEATGDLANAAIQLGSETGSLVSRDVLIEGNLLDGGNYSLNISGAIDAEGIVVRNNQFGETSRYGPVIAPRDDEITVTSDNRWMKTGESIDVDHP
jgi:hypothetical protein